MSSSNTVDLALNKVEVKVECKNQRESTLKVEVQDSIEQEWNEIMHKSGDREKMAMTQMHKTVGIFKVTTIVSTSMNRDTPPKDSINKLLYQTSLKDSILEID
jgi:phage gp16-like protein